MIETPIIVAMIGASVPALGMIAQSISNNKKMASTVDEIKTTVDKINIKVTDIEKNVDDTKHAHQMLQRYRLNYDMNKAICRGYITDLSEFDEMCKLYESYKLLGGNGAVEQLFNRYKDLPIKELEGD